MTAKMKDEVTVRRGSSNALRQASEVVESAMSETTTEDIQAMIEAQLRSAYEEAQSKLQAEIAEPEGLFAWDVLVYGPIQTPVSTFPPMGGPLLPHQIIRTGEDFYVVTVLLFGPAFTTILTPFQVPYEIEYATGEKKGWTVAGLDLQAKRTGQLVPNQPFVVDVVRFSPKSAGLYEMNICARILDCYQKGTPPFSGFARRIQKIEPLLFLPQPLVTYDTGMLFQVYD